MLSRILQLIGKHLVTDLPDTFVEPDRWPEPQPTALERYAAEAECTPEEFVNQLFTHVYGVCTCEDCLNPPF